MVDLWSKWPHTKVVANIQIYLYAKFHIFLGSSSISPIFILSCRFIQLEKDLKWKKPWRVVFSAADPALHRPRPSFACEPACQPVTVPLSLTDGACPSALSSPKSPLLCSALACPRRPNSRRCADHPSPPHATRMAACSPATLSYRVGCGAPWRPVTAVACICPRRLCVGRIPVPTAR
jgi:hypothetical protein